MVSIDLVPSPDLTVSYWSPVGSLPASDSFCRCLRSDFWKPPETKAILKVWTVIRLFLTGK